MLLCVRFTCVKQDDFVINEKMKKKTQKYLCIIIKIVLIKVQTMNSSNIVEMKERIYVGPYPRGGGMVSGHEKTVTRKVNMMTYIPPGPIDVDSLYWNLQKVRNVIAILQKNNIPIVGWEAEKDFRRRIGDLNGAVSYLSYRDSLEYYGFI